MEYKILDLPETATIEEAKRKLRRIRIEYHPDNHFGSSPEQLQKNAKFVALAEDAYEQIAKRLSVAQSIHQTRQSMDMDFMDDMRSRMNRMSRVMEDMQRRRDDSKSKHSTRSSYSYENVNGRVRERGTIDGREMSQEEIARWRNASGSGLMRLME